MVLTRTGQLGFKIEGTPGTAEALTAAEFQGKAKDIEHGYKVNSYKRGIKKAALSPLPNVKGSRLMTVRATDEPVGGDASTEAPWGVRLRACGFQSSALKVISVGAITNAYQIGEAIGDNATQGSATKTGTVVKVITGSPNKIVYLPGTGTFVSGETLYGYTSSPQPSATTSSAASAAGRAYRPVTETNSTPTPSATVAHYEGGEAHVITGAVGTFTMSAKMDEPLLFNWEFTGCPVLDASGRPASAAAVTGITPVGGAPLPCKGMPMAVGVPGGVVPVLTAVEVDVGNAVNPRGTIANNDYVSSGYIGARITDREPKITIDPEYVAGSTLDVIGRAVLGTTFKFYFEYGQTNHANGMIIGYIPAAQNGDEVSGGDRDGIRTTDMQLLATEVNGDDEMWIYHIFV